MAGETGEGVPITTRRFKSSLDSARTGVAEGLNTKPENKERSDTPSLNSFELSSRRALVHEESSSGAESSDEKQQKPSLEPPGPIVETVVSDPGAGGLVSSVETKEQGSQGSQQNKKEPTTESEKPLPVRGASDEPENSEDLDQPDQLVFLKTPQPEEFSPNHPDYETYSDAMDAEDFDDAERIRQSAEAGLNREIIDDDFLRSMDEHLRPNGEDEVLISELTAESQIALKARQKLIDRLRKLKETSPREDDERFLTLAAYPNEVSTDFSDRIAGDRQRSEERLARNLVNDLRDAELPPRQTELIIQELGLNQRIANEIRESLYQRWEGIAEFYKGADEKTYPFEVALARLVPQDPDFNRWKAGGIDDQGEAVVDHGGQTATEEGDDASSGIIGDEEPAIEEESTPVRTESEISELEINRGKFFDMIGYSGIPLTSEEVFSNFDLSRQQSTTRIAEKRELDPESPQSIAIGIAHLINIDWLPIDEEVLRAVDPALRGEVLKLLTIEKKREADLLGMIAPQSKTPAQQSEQGAQESDNGHDDHNDHEVKSRHEDTRTPEEKARDEWWVKRGVKKMLGKVIKKKERVLQTPEAKSEEEKEHENYMENAEIVFNDNSRHSVQDLRGDFEGWVLQSETLKNGELREASLGELPLSRELTEVGNDRSLQSLVMANIENLRYSPSQIDYLLKKAGLSSGEIFNIMDNLYRDLDRLDANYQNHPSATASSYLSFVNLLKSSPGYAIWKIRNSVH